MGKDTYYFSHDSNARNDIKMIRLRRALGIEGYGIYFAIIEILREQEHYQLPLESITDIAFELHTSDEKVKTVVMAYDLFVVDDSSFFSARLLRSMEEYNAKRQKYIDAGRKGGEASVKHRLSIAQPLKVKESKGKGKVNESKENKERCFVAPSIEEVKQYFLDNNYNPVTAERAFNYYDVAGWKDSRGNAVKNWKQKMQSVWFKEENLSQNTDQQFKIAIEPINHRKPLSGK